MRQALAIVTSAATLFMSIPAPDYTFWVQTEGWFKHVYNPSLPDQLQWYINDHTFIRDVNGTWHMFGITHAAPADPDHEIEFAHATAPTLQGPWKKHPSALIVDTASGEKHLWAPHVILVNGIYHMFYNAGGEDDKHQIKLATSTDLFNWKRFGTLF